MSHDFTAVAFCTDNPPYPDLLSRLVQSLERFAIRYETAHYPDTGNWCSNTHIKALFLRGIVRRHEGKKILYIDADAIVRRFPALAAATPEDLGVCYRRLERNGEIQSELLSGTMVFHCSSRILQLFDKWIELNFFNEHVGDQVNLQKAVEIVPVSVRELPPEYAFIFDITRRERPGLEPVIEHFQASRLSRRKNESRSS